MTLIGFPFVNLLCHQFWFLNLCKLLVSTMFGGRNLNFLLYFEWRTTFFFSKACSFLPPELEYKGFSFTFSIWVLCSCLYIPFQLLLFEVEEIILACSAWETHLIFSSLLLALSVPLPDVAFLPWDGELALWNLWCRCTRNSQHGINLCFVCYCFCSNSWC